MPTELFAVGLVLIATFIGAFGALFLKLGSKSFEFKFVKLIKNYKLILGAFLYVVATVFFIWALKHGELSVLYSLVAINYIWATIFSIYFLKEKMNKWKWVGLIFIIIGVVFIGLGR